ncbi:outer membrane receptor protein involved in Fe transport [Rhodanobacter sp. ANJX3]|uniref:TonB-dependent receptor domain-containing protein n=1 Tax=Rhodanobacter sp. ANJX3 TaxID=2723083 RepID=UPI001608CAC5|nr:TonB-dependent receptor [Rhodanobacter sp. ANJX3]MBB5359867.1 outer membrane receptor protein involved in Fe transport [Rhodanobacter sp. ANJX3]
MIKSKMAVAIVTALTLVYSSTHAQSTPETDQTGTSQQSTDSAPSSKKAKKLDEVTVTGSLIPQSQIETAQPITTITAQDIKAKGFTTVAEALQATSFAVGSVQGQQNTNSFTNGAETLSLFGLPVGFTKYLIDGRPMGNFPGLYNGSDTFNSISGIPADLVDHIDILPGGQSSLYGSDAIAGVINIVLKKHVDAPTLDLRYGWSKDGGAADRRVSFADSFSAGKFNSLIGIQFESTQPLWTQDRSVTSHYFTQGTSPAVAQRDSVVVNAGGADPAGYLFLDPSNCGTSAGLFDGTLAKQHRAGKGDYCGTFSPPNGTIKNGTKTANLYTHNTFDVSDNLQLYGDLLYNYSEEKSTTGTGTSFWSNLYAAPGGYFYDDRSKDLISVQHIFSPEEVGGYANTMNSQTENSYMLTLGGKGTFGQSNWDYDLGFTHSDDHLINRDFQRFTGPLETYYKNHVLGAQMGTYYGYPIFEPTYENLYKPVSQADYASFTGYTDNRAKTWDNLVRGQLTNASLFTLPGGDAGVAVVVEGGNEGWNSSPDPRLLETISDVYDNGNQDPYVWGNSAVPGAGHRSRVAATTEFRAPLFSQLTLDVSGRYDKYNVNPQDFSHKTYNIGLEYRPFDTLLLRGRYGTAFKAPTLSDEFQGKSGYFSTVPDYLNCGRLGFNPANITSCTTPYDNEQFNGLTYGNPALKPITAKVWSYGFVWAPIERMSLSVDYLHFDINNEVAQLSASQLSNTEYLCDIGTLDPASGTCAQAFSAITRGPGKTVDVNGVPTQLLGQITNISTPKLNVANEQVNAITAAFNYAYDFGNFGRLSYNMSYSNELKHDYQDFITDPKLDELRHPNFSTDFKTKVNASLTWSKGDWSSTVYVNRYGRTPNYLAQLNDNYTAKGAGKLGAWILWNASVTYTPVKNLDLSLLVNNVFNKMPPVDHSYPGLTAQPYNTLDYNVYGRAMFLEANYKFGSN